MNLAPNTDDLATLLGVCVALAIGMLVGAERERRKAAGSARGAAGIRTFAIVSMLGAVAMVVGGALLLAAATIAIGALTFAAYRPAPVDDPGLTTEVSLLLTCLLGGLAINSPLLAGGVGAALALLLDARARIHRFVRSVMSERELHDALVFVAAALIMLPIAPDRNMGPFLSINPHTIATLIVLVMAASAIGYIATRAMGPRYGLALAGFAGGFISSTATIHSMSVRASMHPALRDAATAGAVLSSVATFIQLGLVVAVVGPALLPAIALPLAAGGVVAAAYGFVLMALTATAPRPPQATPSSENRQQEKSQKRDIGRAFNLTHAIVFAAIVSTVLLLSAALHQW
ncbi:MAG: MgtC/SapB family protein, partial [Aeromicrobium sp.]|nr:MgtC/SapB family protein [Burkholderiales bacterium]